MSRCRPVLLSATVAILALAAPASALADCPGADLQPAQQGAAAAATSTVCLLNDERTSRGLPAVSLNSVLSQASQAYSELMVSRSFFAHETPEGTDLVTRLEGVGYLGDDVEEWTVGENLAWAQGALSTPRQIVAAWMNSPGHRENVLNGDFAEIGIGIAPGTPQAGPDGATFTTDFGTRKVEARRPARDRGRAASARAVSRARAAKRAKAKARARVRHARSASARGRSRKTRSAAHRTSHRHVLRARVLAG
jgi:uncharacterized protein YkwD